MVQRYKTKPTINEAMQFTSPNDLADLKKFCPVAKESMSNSFKKQLMVKTNSGEAVAEIGDWIVKGVHGEFWPVKPEVFAARYELADPVVSE